MGLRLTSSYIRPVDASAAHQVMHVSAAAVLRANEAYPNRTVVLVVWDLVTEALVYYSSTSSLRMSVA